MISGRPNFFNSSITCGIKDLAALNATGIEVDGNGTDDRTEAATKQVGKEGHGWGVAWGKGIRETQTAQGHRRSTKENRPSVRIAGSRWSQPRAQGLQTSAKAVSPQTSSGTGHPGGIRKSEACNDAREIASYAVMVGGYYAEGATDFYTTAERRGTAMKKGI